MHFSENIFKKAPKSAENTVKSPSEQGKKFQSVRAERVKPERAAEEHRRVEKEAEAAAAGVERKEEERGQEHDAEARVG